MRKLRSDAYLAHLTPKDRESLQAKLLDEKTDLKKLAKTLPPWRAGRWKGQHLSYSSLIEMSARARSEKIIAQIDANARTVEKIKEKLGRDPNSNSETLDAFCSLVGQELLTKAFKELTPRERTLSAQILLKRQDQLLATAKFKRDTCKIFLDWYQDERARQILDSREAAASKLQQLGKLIYGEEW